MKVCVYDNPLTMARECWQDGQIRCSYHSDLFLRKPSPWELTPMEPNMYFFGANIGDWKEGQLVGDASAMLMPKG